MGHTNSYSPLTTHTLRPNYSFFFFFFFLNLWPSYSSKCPQFLTSCSVGIIAASTRGYPWFLIFSTPATHGTNLPIIKEKTLWKLLEFVYNFLLILSMFANFYNALRSIIISFLKCLNCKFLCVCIYIYIFFFFQILRI